MPLTHSKSEWDRVKKKINGFFDGLAEDLKPVGETAAEAILRTTLAGVGANDQTFLPYSASYLAKLEAVGGKPRQVVDLRGVFYGPGSAEPISTKKNALRGERKDAKLRSQGANRRAFVSVTAGGRTFTAQTAITRPQLGLTDPNSELSLDLITITTTDTSLKITYTPRRNRYMLFHQDGEGKNPKREWFSLNKTGVLAAMTHMLKTVLAARAQRFNDPNASSVRGPVTHGPPPADAA
jgi:hypothetical protein